MKNDPKSTAEKECACAIHRNSFDDNSLKVFKWSTVAALTSRSIPDLVVSSRESEMDLKMDIKQLSLQKSNTFSSLATGGHRLGTWFDRRARKLSMKCSKSITLGKFLFISSQIIGLVLLE